VTPSRREMRTIPVLALLAAGCTGQIGPEGATGGGGGPPTRHDASVSAPSGDGGTTPKSDAHRSDAPTQKGSDAAITNYVFEPSSAGAAVSKVKTVLTGLPATAAEVAAVQANAGAMKTLVAQWILTPQYQQKMLEFFEVAFQQNQSAINDFIASQIPDNAEFAANDYTYNNLMLANYHEMFARTALELIAEGKPFTDTFTTTSFMVTPALAASMAIWDSQHYNDNGSHDLNENARRYADAGIRVTFESNGPIASAANTDPTNANFLTFYSSSVSPGAANHCLTSPVTYTPVPRFDQLFDDTLFVMVMGLGFKPSESYVNNDPFTDAGAVPVADGGDLPPGACNSYIDTSTLSVADFQHWRMVNIRKPAAGEAPTPYWDVDAFRSASELLFNIERIGFFTTPSFLASWNTNVSNQARVTMNQTLIVALNQAFDGTDQTTPLSLAAVDTAHLLPGCAVCHYRLDPMRQFFRHDLTIPFHEQIDASGLPGEYDAGAGNPNTPPQFVWGGVAQQGATIADLARLLTQQPNVASGWAQKLCQWGNSSTCDPSDPEFQRIVGVFQDSNFDWNALVTELFSSPIVTYLAPSVTAEQEGETVPIARQGHLCALLSNRLGITDICGLDPATKVPYTLQPTQVIAGAYPSDQFSRGQVSPSVFVLANDPNLFIRSGLENLCLSVASQVIDTAGSRYSSATWPVAIQDFVHNLMGLNDERAQPMVELLTDHYNDALGEAPSDAGVVTATDALRSTFTLACLSPYVMGIGQ
jgi:hypothetical protein